MLEQPSKAPLPIYVAFLGILNDVSPVQPANAQAPIFVTPSAISTVLILGLRECHGVSVFISQSTIEPEPVMVSLPPSNVHLVFAPQTPDSVTLFCSDISILGAIACEKERGVAVTADMPIIKAAAAAIIFFMNILHSQRPADICRQVSSFILYLSLYYHLPSCCFI